VTALVTGLVLFLGMHSISIVAPSWRNLVAERMGEDRWRGLFAAVALVGFVLIGWGYSAVREAPMLLYVAPYGLRYVTLLLMAFVFPLLVAAYFPGRIQVVTRHPMLLGTELWAVAHLLVNGALADVVLFGSFLTWAAADRASLKYRPARPILGAPPSRWNDPLAVVVGLVLYAAFVLGAHRWLFGVPIGISWG